MFNKADYFYTYVKALKNISIYIVVQCTYFMYRFLNTMIH